jgi:hypothetical protein
MKLEGCEFGLYVYSKKGVVLITIARQSREVASTHGYDTKSPSQETK